MSGVRKPGARRSAIELCEEGNRLIAYIGRSDIHWVVREGWAVLEWTHPPRAAADDDDDEPIPGF